ncbi:hypothetical protein VTK26DRAFT_4327 [Humicola hyalothermophila]
MPGFWSKDSEAQKQKEKAEQEKKEKEEKEKKEKEEREKAREERKKAEEKSGSSYMDDPAPLLRVLNQLTIICSNR